MQNIIERWSVTTDEELIDAEQVLPLIEKKKKGFANQRLTKLQPLKEAVKSLEEQLILQPSTILKNDI